jgi:hypothetical protein
MQHSGTGMVLDGFQEAIHLLPRVFVHGAEWLIEEQ